jgi:hypothetical protein
MCIFFAGSSFDLPVSRALDSSPVENYIDRRLFTQNESWAAYTHFNLHGFLASALG